MKDESVLLLYHKPFSVLPVGIEPTSYPPQGYVLSIERREQVRYRTESYALEFDCRTSEAYLCKQQIRERPFASTNDLLRTSRLYRFLALFATELQPEKVDDAIYERFVMAPFLEMLVEEIIEFDGIGTHYRYEQVRGEDMRGLDRKRRRKIRVDVLEDREGEYPFIGIRVIIHDDPFVRDLEMVKAGPFRDGEREGPCSREHQQREDDVAEEDARDRDGKRDDPERPIPIGALLLEGVFGRFPFEKDRARHR